MDNNIQKIESFEEKNICDWCQKEYTNVYTLKRHMLKCKTKQDHDNQYLIDQHNEFNKQLSQSELKYNHVLSQYEQSQLTIQKLTKQLEMKEEEMNSLRNKVIDEKNISFEYKSEVTIYKTKVSCYEEHIRRLEKQLDLLLNKMSTSSYNNIVATLAPEVHVTHETIMPKCEQLLTQLNPYIK